MFSAPKLLATTNPFVFITGNQYSVHTSVVCGKNPLCLKGVNVLLSADWLNSLPLCTSTYWPSVSVSSFSHIIPCCDNPHIHIFLPALSSCVEYRPMPKSSSCQYPPKKSVYFPNT